MIMTQRAGGSRPVPTLEMVAALAGVSRATVSRVVNDSPSVDPELAQSVRKAIEALDYTPNRAARSLAKRRANSVALIIPESTSKVFADPFFTTVVQGIAMYLTDTDFTLNMVIASEAKPEKTRSFLLGGNVDGALVVYVEVENEAAACSATRLLTASGRRSIATIAGPQDMPPGIDRLAGWRTAVREAGLDDQLVEVGDFTLASGARAMQRLLDRGRPVDAVFAANDQMAAGAYTVIQGRGLRIPEDIAVVGFDDDSFATSVTPALTTVNHPIVELGRKMAETLVDMIEGRPTDRVTIMSTSLVLRDSV
jgi:DNA-binding LacI/PurR family transcriptional regulator